MLFIHGGLSLGGVETFYVRMAKERHRKGLKTSILLQKPESEHNEELLLEASQYAKVYYLDDFFINIPMLTKKFPLLAPIRKNQVIEAFVDIDQIHVYGAMYGLLAQRLLGTIHKKIPITIGFYHYNHYLWGGKKLPYNIKKDREFVFKYLPRNALLFFSEGNRDYHCDKLKTNFNESHTFRLGVVDQKVGVVDQKPYSSNGSIEKTVNIITIGRLVDFKTYNIYMLDVVRSLIDKGYSVIFNIYGNGPLYNTISDRIKKLKLSENVILHGTLEYKNFDEVVKQADLFIGSGTALIQAASLGVPSIVGIENMNHPESYGYFSDVHRYEYNLKGLDLPVINIENMIEDFILMQQDQRLSLQKRHLESIEDFTNETCQKLMDSLKDIKMPHNDFKFNRWLYEISRSLYMIDRKYNNKNFFKRKFIYITRLIGFIVI